MSGIKIFFSVLILFFIFLISPAKIFAQCDNNSAAGCQGGSPGDPCGNGGTCFLNTVQPTPGGSKCSCRGTIPPGTPVPTTPPAPPIGWYAPDGSPCNRTNYHAYYALASCTGKAGFVTEGISPQSNCSTNGSGKCFLASGPSYTQISKSYWKLDSQTCTQITVPLVPTNAYDQLFECRFGLGPTSSINGSVTAYFTNIAQFEKIYVWIVDSQEGFSRFYEVPKSQIVNGRANAFTFDQLFPDKKYDVYAKAYGAQGVYLDKVVYNSSCNSPGCRSYPGVTVDFKLDFPKPLSGTFSNLVSNNVFQQMIDKWVQGQISTIEMSRFIAQVARVPGLQKAYCDPSFPGGCNL